MALLSKERRKEARKKKEGEVETFLTVPPPAPTGLVSSFSRDTTASASPGLSARGCAEAELPPPIPPLPTSALASERTAPCFAATSAAPPAPLPPMTGEETTMALTAATSSAGSFEAAAAASLAESEAAAAAAAPSAKKPTGTDATVTSAVAQASAPDPASEAQA